MVLSNSPAVDDRSPDRPGGETASRAAAEIRLRPVRPLGAGTWLAESGGEWVAARPLPFLVEGAQGRVQVAHLPRLPHEAGSEHLIRFTGVAVADGTRWAVSQYVPGAPLDRLLTVATLTPRQATTVAIEVLAGLASLHAGGLVHGRLTPRTVRVGDDGVVRIGDWAVGTLDRTAGPGLPDRFDDPATAAGVLADLGAARRIVADLARNADRPVVHRGGFDAELIAGLARMGVSEAMEAAIAEAELRHLLDGAGGASVRPEVHAELAALVAAANLRLPETSRRPSAGSDPGNLPAPIRPAPPRLQRGRLSGADWHVPNRRRTAWAVVATVGVLAAGALALTVGPGRSVGDRLLHRQPGASTAPSGGSSTSPAHHGLAARQRVAPAAAGIVHGVSARAVTRCAPGKPCRLRVAVRITPSPSLRRLHWVVSVDDRCTGVRSSRPGGLLVAAPGATSVRTTRTVTLPAGRALAVSALITRPARAASAPLLVPASVRTC